MGRPKKSEATKRQGLSISVSPEIKALAEASGNSSQYFESAVRTCRAISDVFKTLGKSVKKDVFIEAMEDVEDMVTVWERQFDETLPFAPASKPRAGTAGPRKKKSKKSAA